MMRRLVALGCAAAIGCGGDLSELPAVGTLERDRIELIAETDDPIAEIALSEGDVAAAGQLVLRLDDTRLRAQHGTLEAARDEARARLAELERGPRTERISEGRARLAGAQSAAATARSELERARSLASRDVASQARLDAAQGQYDEAVAREKAARAALDAQLEGTTLEELDQGRSALAAAEAALAESSVRLDRLAVRAPRAVRVDALPFERGERPPRGGVVAVLLAEGTPYARVYVPQPLRVRLRPGTPARVFVPGLDRELPGRLRVIASEAAFTPYFALTEHDRGHLAYLAEVDIDAGGGDGLPTGVPVEVRFDIGDDGDSPP